VLRKSSLNLIKLILLSNMMCLFPNTALVCLTSSLKTLSYSFNRAGLLSRKIFSYIILHTPIILRGHMRVVRGGTSTMGNGEKHSTRALKLERRDGRRCRYIRRRVWNEKDVSFLLSYNMKFCSCSFVVCFFLTFPYPLY
jgi:hypothetical protein